MQGLGRLFKCLCNPAFDMDDDEIVYKSKWSIYTFRNRVFTVGSWKSHKQVERGVWFCCVFETTKSAVHLNSSGSVATGSAPQVQYTAPAEHMSKTHSNMEMILTIPAI